MKLSRVELSLLFLATALLSSAGTWRESGKPVPDSPWAKSDGDFGAQLVLTDKPDHLFAAWEKPGPAVLISETTQAVSSGKPIVGVIFFAGCAPNEGGNCNTTVHFTVIGPDRQAYGSSIDGELWVDKPPPPEGQMQLSLGNIAVVIEPKDILGTYKVIAEILDNVSKKTMRLERSFEAVASPGSK